MSLDRLIQAAQAARETTPEWTPDRAQRVFAGTMRRASREKSMRRAFGGISAAAVVVVLLLRSASAPAEARLEHASVIASQDIQESAGDGGYGRD